MRDLRCARLATLVVAAFVSGAALADANWWKTFTLEPRDTELLGVAVGRVNRDWVRATALEASALSAAQRAELTGKDRQFVLNGDFNADGRPDRVLVGVYQDKQGKRGSFVAVFTRRDDRSWQAVYSEVGDEPGQFSVLHQPADNPYRLYWDQCLDCTSSAAVTWGGNGFFLSYF